MIRVVIVHGFNADPQQQWFPWLRRELEKRRYQVVAPAMPHPMHPNGKEWAYTLERAVGSVDGNTIFVGHSLGVLAILRHLESQHAQCRGLVAVAPFIQPKYNMLFPEFFDKGLDFETLRKVVPHGMVLADPKDYLAPFANAEYLARNLNASLHACTNRGHFNDAIDHVTEAPEILDAVLDIAGPQHT